MARHSNVVGGSKIERRNNCYASYIEEQNAPEETVSEYADEGSMLHAVMEMLIINNARNMKEVMPLLDEAIGQDFGYPGHEFTLEHIEAKIKPAIGAWFHIRDSYPLIDWFIEIEVSLESVIEGAFGTADILGIDKARYLHVVDWKFGDGVPVSAEGNKGLGFYAACALHDQDSEIRDAFADPIAGVIFHIVQPRRGHSGPVHDAWETSVEWVETLLDQTIVAIEHARKPNPPYKPGEWCRWCRAKATCNARKSMVLESMSKQPTAMTDVELGQLITNAKLAEKWAQDAISFAQREMENGANASGFKLVQKQARRQWQDAAAVESILKKSRVKSDAMYDKKLKSPAQIEKFAKNVYCKKLSEMVISHSSGVTIAPDSDKRAAVVGSMALLTNALEHKPETGNSENE